MTDQTALVRFRLAVVATLGGLLLILACRPAWSPDGQKLLFHALVGPEHLGVAVYDRTTGKARLLTEDPIENNLAALAWTPDSKTAVIVSEGRSDKVLDVEIRGLAADSKARQFEIPIGGDKHSAYLIPPIVIGRHLFVATGDIARLDLQSGEVESSKAPVGHAFSIARRGDGLCYLSLPEKKGIRGWEIGTLDPETLARTPIVRAPADTEWKPIPLPSFTPTLDRIAMPARRIGDKEVQALLVIREGKIETMLPLEDDSTVGISSVEWARDGVTLLVGMCRRDLEANVDSFCLFETTFSGSVTRQITILKVPRNKENEAPGFMFPMALSPDGKTAAFSSALIENAEPEQHGLYLVDLDAKDRRVTRVQFPKKK